MKEMDRRTLIAIVVSVLIFGLWQKFYVEPLQKQHAAHQASKTAAVLKDAAAAAPAPRSAGTSAVTSAAAVAVGTTESQPSAPGQFVPGKAATGPVAQALELPLNETRASIGNGYNFLEGWTLDGYGLTKKPGSPRVSLVQVTTQPEALTLAFDRKEGAYDYRYLKEVRGNLTREGKAVVWKYRDANVSIERRLEPDPSGQFLQGRLRMKFASDQVRPKSAFLSLYSVGFEDSEQGREQTFAYWTNGSLNTEVVGNDLEVAQIDTQVGWVAATSRYFALALAAGEGYQPAGRIQTETDRSGWVSLVYPVFSNEVDIPFKVFFGTKEVDVMAKVHPTMSELVDLGWFSFFAHPLLNLMKWFYGFFGNYGLAIILLTILVKLVTFPLTYISMKKMRKMAELQPKLQALRERFGDDKEALNREMMSFMRNNGYNPVSGCLPMLVQIPVFIALYRVLYTSVELYQSPFFGWIQDLSLKDPYYVTPILLTLTMVLQQKVTPNTATDPTQQKILQFMPLMFGFIMLSLPSGLTLYMLVNALTGILQQILINKKLGMPGGQAVATTARA